MPVYTVGPNGAAGLAEANDEPTTPLLFARASPWTARFPAVPLPASANVTPASTAESKATMIVRRLGGPSFRILHPPVVVSGRNFPEISPNETHGGFRSGFRS